MRTADVVRARFGSALLAAPGQLVRLTGAEADAPAVAAIDGAHTASMIALGTREERHRSACFANALTAAALAAASLVETRRGL